MEKKVVIVTGSLGRIGSRITSRLSKHYTVVGLDLLKGPSSSNQETLSVDLASEKSLAEAFAHIHKSYGNKIASVIHLAAYYSFDQKHSEKYDLITVQGTEKLLKALHGFEVEQFVFTSTMLVHEKTMPGKPINENSPVVPSWDYPLSKIKTEKLIKDQRRGIPSVILRIAGVYDDGCHSIPISHQIERIYEKQPESRFFSGDTSHGAAFIHMDDLVDAIEIIVNKRKELNEELVLLLAEPVTMSYDAMQRKISSLLFHKEFHTFRLPKWFARIGAAIQCALAFKKKPFIKPWMISIADDHYEIDISKAKRHLDWTPRHRIETTLPKMIEALKANPKQWYKDNGLS